MTTKSETFERMVAWMQAKNLPLDSLREIERGVRALPTGGAGNTEMVGMAVRRVVRLRVEAELGQKSDDELRAVAAALTGAEGRYADQLLGPAQSDALVTLAASRHPEAAAAVEEWEQTDDSVGAVESIRRYHRLGAFDYYATAADLD